MPIGCSCDSRCDLRLPPCACPCHDDDEEEIKGARPRFEGLTFKRRPGPGERGKQKGTHHPFQVRPPLLPAHKAPLLCTLLGSASEYTPGLDKVNPRGILSRTFEVARRRDGERS